jgi:serine/threonine-protein kinase
MMAANDPDEIERGRPMSDPLTRLRDSLERSRSGDPTARRELEDGLRDLSAGEYRDVLARWREARARGETVSPDELCRQRPGSEPTVAEVLRLVADINACLDAGAVTATGTAPGRAGEGAPRLPDVPGYELLGVLGRGGMGVVYRARQLGFNRVVALKMIRAAGGEAGERARFRVEAQAVARLRHPNIVQVFDTGEADGCPYFSMEYLEGGSLADRARAEPLPPRRAAEVVEALARAIHHAHERGVIHRDLKPSNVLLDSGGTPKVADFGLARLLDADVTRTASQVVLGTACYMAPEQAAGRSRDVGPATDVYGLGAVLYELLTGRPPVEGDSWAAVLERVRTAEPVEPRRRRPEVSRDLEAVCLKALAKEPARRYASAQDLADDLRRFLNAEPTRVRPPGRAGRAWRFARRHPGTSVAAFLLLLAAAAAPVLAAYLDPDRVPKQNLARLGRGETATLAGPTGPPRWWRNLIGRAEVFDPRGEEGGFAVGTFDPAAYVELLPATPPSGYRFGAEFRQMDRARRGKVGVYFAHGRFDTSGGVEHCFAVFTFTDLLAEGRRPDDEAENRAPVELRRCAPGRLTADTGAGIVRRFRPAIDRGGPTPWRRLEVVVTPQQVRAYWDGDFVGQAARQQMVQRFQGLVNRPGNPASYEPALAPEFAPGGGLGLVVEETSALVRNVTVGPPDDPGPHD